MQIEGDFEYLYSSESPRLTSKWEGVAPILIDRMKDCKDPSAVSLMAQLSEDAVEHKIKSNAGKI